MLMHYLLSEGVSEPHGLKELSGDLLGADPHYDDPVKKYAPKMTDSYANVPRELLYKYCAQDVIHTYQIHDLLAEKLQQPRYRGLDWTYRHILLPASRMLQAVEQRGVWVHKPTLETLARELNEELETARETLQREAAAVWDPATYATWKGTAKPPIGFNPGSAPQLLWVLKQFGLTPHDPRSGKVSTDKEALTELPQTPFVTALRDYRKAQKMLSTYVEGIYDRIEDDGRVHATYLLHGTATGRLSSRGPNMQNIPRDARIRNVFQAGPGHSLVELDYSQVELRVLAYLSGDAALSRVYEEGRDLHDEVALSLFGEGFTKEQRIRAKFVNFGIAYGRGAESLVAEFKMPKHEAQAMIRGWWETFPDAHRYIMAQRAASREGKPLVTPFGRSRRFDLITNLNRNQLENEAANFAIQSTASDLTLLSAISMQEGLREWESYIINLVHDSILIEAPSSLVQRVGEHARQVMEGIPRRALKTTLPFTVSLGVAQAWGQLK